MIDGIPKISVLVITYEQKNIVSRTLDSLIAQRDYLHEICVSDDCSFDGTWEVLLDYQNRFPDLIKLHRQEPNVGIFKNTEYSWTMPTGDIINEIAGDDTTPDGWYKAVAEFVLKNNIDWKNESFCIYGDYKAEYPNGDSFIFSNRKVIQRGEMFRKKWRGLLSGRGSCYSRQILKRLQNVSQGRSHIVERAQDMQVVYWAEKSYYISRLSNVYYTGIGISTRLSDEMLEERIKIPKYAKDYYERLGHSFSKTDIHYLEYEMMSIRYQNDKTIKVFLKMLLLYLQSLDLSLPGMGFNMRRYLFAFLRRIPHKNPICMHI